MNQPAELAPAIKTARASLPANQPTKGMLMTSDNWNRNIKKTLGQNLKVTDAFADVTPIKKKTQGLEPIKGVTDVMNMTFSGNNAFNQSTVQDPMEMTKTTF